jgi:peroxiredoxin
VLSDAPHVLGINDTMRMKNRYIIYAVATTIALGGVAMSWYLAMNPIDDGGPQITFLDVVESNGQPQAALAEFRFNDPDGNEIVISDLLTHGNVVLVVLQGNIGSVCPYCSTQTSRLIANYAEFSRRNTEVVVVYPVEKQEDVGAYNEFLGGTKKRLNDPDTVVPFPMVLDVGLTVVDQLGLRAFLSKPATYILDRRGNVRFAYIGANLADRPSVQAMLDVIDSLDT